jgi:excisionase family DNA binding protein
MVTADKIRDPLLSVKEASAACGCDPSTLRRFMSKGLLPFFQIGRWGHIKIRRSTLEEFQRKYEHRLVSNA